MTDKEYAAHRKAVAATAKFLAKRTAFRKTAAYRQQVERATVRRIFGI